MPKIIKVFGDASNKLIKIIQVPESLSSTLSLMNFLIENSIPIASSCGGEGVCERCVINEKTLSCQIMLVEYLAAQHKSSVNTESECCINIEYL